jgi:hypothetical protein
MVEPVAMIEPVAEDRGARHAIPSTVLQDLQRPLAAPMMPRRSPTCAAASDGPADMLAAERHN